MGETRVDLQHLLEDIRDAYTGSIEETILTEVVANALDSGATAIRVVASPLDGALTVVDNGRGMQRRELARYHDIAASAKKRGEGIGFAGVGIKLGLLVSREVVTETRRGATHVATRWHLASRHRAPWKWIPAPGLLAERGTAVRLTLVNPLSMLLDAGFLDETLRRHFEPLVDPSFAAILSRHYSTGIQFEIDGRPIAGAVDGSRDRVAVAIRLARRRTASAVGYLERSERPLPEDRQGMAFSTYGKIIKRGWDWLGVTPLTPDRITGLIEAPELAACLTLSKNDFLRSGPRGATYLAYRKALQEIVSRQLASWGDDRRQTDAPRPQRLDRELERVLEDLAGRFPLLHSLVDRRPGGRSQLSDGGSGNGGVGQPLLAMLERPPVTEEPTPPPNAVPGGESEPQSVVPPEGPEAVIAGNQPEENRNATGSTDQPPESDQLRDIAAVPGEGAPKRGSRYGLSLQFEPRPDDDELARLVDNTVWVNDAHPAFRRAQQSRSLGYHMALAVALALAPLAAPPAEEHLFVTRFLAEWGGSPTRRRSRRRRS